MYDIIIIGGGPAGLNAALYALRAGKSVLILERNMIGGQISNSPKLENFPTILEIKGFDFAMQFLEQVEKWGGQVEYDTVLAVTRDVRGSHFTVTTECCTYEAKAVIAATGVEHKHIQIPGEKEFLGKGVYYCALCDGPMYADKEVALIGDGNTAMQYALMLSNICSKVHMLTWTDKFFGDDALRKAIINKENIIHMPNTSVTSFIGDELLTNLEYHNNITRDVHWLSVSAVFVAIGQVPNNQIFEHLTRLDKYGYFVTNADMSTQAPGFFVAGDCRDKPVRQVVTAISDGAIAATSACKYIDSL